jgi:hypothetical protein
MCMPHVPGLQGLGGKKSCSVSKGENKDDFYSSAFACPWLFASHPPSWDIAVPRPLCLLQPGIWSPLLSVIPAGITAPLTAPVAPTLSGACEDTFTSGFTLFSAVQIRKLGTSLTALDSQPVHQGSLLGGLPIPLGLPNTPRSYHFSLLLLLLLCSKPLSSLT